MQMAMNRRTRAVIFLQFFIMAVLAIGLWSWDAGNQVFMNMPNIQQAMVVDRQMDQSTGHNVTLFPAAHWQQELVKRMEARGALADALIAERINLLHAAEGFRDLDSRSPNFDLESFRKHMPGTTDEEKYCLLVIEVVQGQFKVPLDDFATEVVSKLETELDRLMSTNSLRFSAVSTQMPSLESQPKKFSRIPPQPYIPTHEHGMKPVPPPFTPGR
jgi:hypothetical protein